MKRKCDFKGYYIFFRAKDNLVEVVGFIVCIDDCIIYIETNKYYRIF